jgi:hypothetical protein
MLRVSLIFFLARYAVDANLKREIITNMIVVSRSMDKDPLFA